MLPKLIGNRRIEGSSDLSGIRQRSMTTSHVNGRFPVLARDERKGDRLTIKTSEAGPFNKTAKVEEANP